MTLPVPDPLAPPTTTPDPRDEFTLGSGVWLAGGVVLGAVEVYGLVYDKRHPGNRRKWTLTSNVLTLAGWDSVTGEPLDVPFGAVRRSALVMVLAWLTAHWTFPVKRRGTY